MTGSGPCIALWLLNLGHVVPSASDWLALVDMQAEDAARQGADILLMPEHLGEHWLHFAPVDLPVTEQPQWFSSQTDSMLSGLRKIAMRHDLLLVAGSWPVHDNSATMPGAASPLVNRCHLIFPDGSLQSQDKLCLTPCEKDPTGWMMSPGKQLSVFRYKGFRLIVNICLDVELPALATRVSALEPDLLLVPAMTIQPSGYHRVFSCAKARAIELGCAVAVTGLCGGITPEDSYCSGAAVYLPCQSGLNSNGVHASLPPQMGDSGPGKLLIAKDLPLQELRELRHQSQPRLAGWSSEPITFNAE
ncbi:MAG: hypothetical protein Alpg2KO_31040 [Alphaproteobacteria bacterium]